MTIERFLGSSTIRELGENEVYYCTEGCGACSKVSIEENNMTMHTPNETILLERHYTTVEVSSCCKAEVGIWNEEADQEIEVDYVFTENRNKPKWNEHNFAAICLTGNGDWFGLHDAVKPCYSDEHKGQEVTIAAGKGDFIRHGNITDLTDIEQYYEVRPTN